MREFLTDQEVDLVLCYADYDMRINPVASAMHYDRRTIYRKLENIFRETGYNPLEFWDLYTIIRELEKEGVDGRTAQISPKQDAVNSAGDA